MVAKVTFPSGLPANQPIPEASRDARGSDAAFRTCYARLWHLKGPLLILGHGVIITTVANQRY